MSSQYKPNPRVQYQLVNIAYMLGHSTADERATLINRLFGIDTQVARLVQEMCVHLELEVVDLDD